MEQPGIYLQEGFSAKIESRKLGVVAAMAGFLTWTDQDQTDEVQFVVAERDCNHFDTNQRFGRHKVFFLVLFFFGKKSHFVQLETTLNTSFSGHYHLPQAPRRLQDKLPISSHQHI